MTRPIIPIAFGILSVVFGTLLYFFQLQNPIIKWVLYIGLAASLFIFELSLLTVVLDQLSYKPVLAILLVLISLAVFVLIGFAARSLYADTLLYWLFGTVYPAIGGLLYIVDILQKH